MTTRTVAPIIVTTLPRSFREHVERGRVLWRLAFHRRYKSLVRRLGVFIPAGSTALDIGGNHGRVAAELAMVHQRSLAVHSFEPLQYNFQMLEFVARRHHNLHPHPYGLSDENRRIYLYTPVRSNGVVEHGGSFIAPEPPHGTDPSRPILVQTNVELRHGDTALDELGVRSFAFAKIDVEGHESSVLNGLWNRIERDLPLLFMEILPVSGVPGSRTHEMLERLRACGYQIVLDDEATKAWRVVMWSSIPELTASKGQDLLFWHPQGVGGRTARGVFQ